MRFAGLTLCLLASSLGARAESVEDRVAALEARVKALEMALSQQGSKPIAAVIDGTYVSTLPNGESVTLEQTPAPTRLRPQRLKRKTSRLGR